MKLPDMTCFIRRCGLVLLCMMVMDAWSMEKWGGPIDGPPGQKGKNVTFISQDFRNGGITAAYRGFFTASKELGWSVRLIDGKGSDRTIRDALDEAVKSHQDAIIAGGFDIDEFAEAVGAAQRGKIVLAGWHAAAEPGPTKDLFVNISTSPEDVAKIAADYLVASSKGAIGVVIFNDSRFAVANAKTNRMREIIERCLRCKVLAIENIPISAANIQIPFAVSRLDREYGKAWTHSLAINDVYFDSMNVPLARINRTDIRNVSAGDGSSIALGRIKSGRSQQLATVAEPAELQGWQLADELNRAFAGAPPSGYVASPILITTPYLNQNDSIDSDAKNPFRRAYRQIWQK